MRTCQLLAPTLAFLAAATPAPAAASRPPLDRLGPLDPATQLADRFLVSQPAPTTLRVDDVIARTSRDIALPPSCHLQSARWRLALLGCEVAGVAGPWAHSCVRPYLVFLGPGEVRYIRARGAPADGCDPERLYTFVGRYWLLGIDRSLDPHPSVSYLNWRTGEVRYPRSDPDGIPASVDVDDPALRPHPEKRAHVEGRLQVPYRWRDTAPVRLRVGRGPYVVLSRCRSRCWHVHLAAGRVVWLEGGSTLRAYVPRTRVSWRWRLPRGDGGSAYPYKLAVTRAVALVTAFRRETNVAYVIRWAR